MGHIQEREKNQNMEFKELAHVVELHITCDESSKYITTAELKAAISSYKKRTGTKKPVMIVRF